MGSPRGTDGLIRASGTSKTRSGERRQIMAKLNNNSSLSTRWALPPPHYISKRTGHCFKAEVSMCLWILNIRFFNQTPLRGGWERWVWSWPRGKTGTSLSSVHRSAPRADWPLSTENSDISLSLGPERPTLPDPQGSDSAGPEPLRNPGAREGQLWPLPKPPHVNCGPTPPGHRGEEGPAHDARRPGPGLV